MRLGLDIGGTKIDAVALGGDDAVLSRVRVATGFGSDAVVRNAHEAAIQAAEAAGASAAALTSVGIGIPGVVDARAGVVRHAVNLGLEELALGRVLSERLGASVRVENDVNAASLGAYHLLGLTASMAYLNLGTGVAAGFVSDGDVWRGARGTAGEIGHIPIDPHGIRCACGQIGCLETVAGGGWVARKWGGDAAFPVLEVFDRADAGDERALALRSELIGGAAAGVRILILTADVETVVIGGGIANLGERLLDRVRANLDELALGSQFLSSLELSSRVRLVPPGSPVAAVGAALAGDIENAPVDA
ncbi:ROK family protein [Gryllotalpicola protaetiae]|uniref:ROK family protein n=1 Tax=Gryllotalpicola protaetiae TaxID=2419771 RepID=A0A387BPF0_9MICO|nr:ROK family protein [Gryllotalpicola protaetiae]AYG02897.1 ROK family protein [Gryllotalpicola protaetiae]